MCISNFSGSPRKSYTTIIVLRFFDFNIKKKPENVQATIITLTLQVYFIQSITPNIKLMLALDN